MGPTSSFGNQLFFWIVFLKTMYNNGWLQISQARLGYLESYGLRTLISNNYAVISTCIDVLWINLACLITRESLIDGNIFLILSLDAYILIFSKLVQSFSWALIIMFCSSTLRSWPSLHVQCWVNWRVSSCSVTYYFGL